MDILTQIRYKAGLNGLKTIVFPESHDLRILKAAAFLSECKMCDVILVGDIEAIQKKAAEEALELPSNIRYKSILDDPSREDYINSYYNSRKHKGITREIARVTLEDHLYFGAALVAAGEAHGCVAGADHTTADVLRAAIQIIGLKSGSDVISSTFLMYMPDEKPFTYADCAVVPYPYPAQLAAIAVDSAETHFALTGEKPKVAMLSFSTRGSALHERSRLVLDALEIARKKDPELVIDGELQFDAAYVPEVALKKAPDSEVAGKANVFIFPNLDAGNIAYKITERLAGATAIGPIVQGLAKPMNDLSRGCSWEDVVNMACVTALMSEYGSGDATSKAPAARSRRQSG